MEMFIDIMLLHLSLMVNFKDKITAFVLMKTIFIALVLKQIILFSFEMCNDIDEKKDISMVTVKPTDNNDFFLIKMLLWLGGNGRRNWQYWLKAITSEGWLIVKNCFENLTAHRDIFLSFPGWAYSWLKTAL